jgi:hypothetical protein
VKACPKCGGTSGYLKVHRVTGTITDSVSWDGMDIERCGDAWNEDGRVQRPFRRGWRKDSVRVAWGAFARFRKTLASIPPGA